ncbi:polysaccharide lyase family 1 protein [Canariomyces notabilis]|uniref:Polysaccharide lyase family 1 protein n=1 Tax=Canariomyces notabilis TaxID=2074819 RepID=A0AAN6T8J6_9PEZI|nr:polysaccharide lyase family 1 protein [Canariomyces arenarius]
MKLLKSFLLVSYGGYTACSSPGGGSPTRRQYEPELATYDDACNVGYCSVMGATIGGWGTNEYTTVSTLEQFANAVSSTGPAVVIVEGAISGEGKVTVGSYKSILGAPGSSLAGIGLSLNQSRNVILRNFKISKVPASQGPAISVENSRSIWIDHCDLSSGSDRAQTAGPYAPSLLSISQNSDLVTVTATLFHDHPQAVVVGQTDKYTKVDNPDGKPRVTFARNYFRSLGNAVSYSFGTGHLFNSLYENVTDGINTGMGANLLIESSIFEKSGRAIYSNNSTEAGYATVRDVLLGGASNSALAGEMTADSLPYPYDWYIWETSRVQELVVDRAGQTLDFLK